MSNDRKPIHIAIVGSRDYPRLDLVRAFVAQLPADGIMVSGGAQGVDTVAEEAALAAGLATLIIPTDRAGIDCRNGLIRNAEIVAHADRLAAFWDGTDPDLANLVLQAAGRRLPVEIYGPDGAPVPIEQALRAARGKARLMSV